MSAQQPIEALPITAAEAEALFTDCAHRSGLLVAVSGGPDSVALLALLADWAALPGRPRLSAATVDHGFRLEARSEALSVAGLCDSLGVPHAILDWQGERPRSSFQQAARTMRYRLLTAHALRQGCDMLLTAHTLDDQAETLLMRMAHGSGPAGLAGMRPSTLLHGISLARPLLGIGKARLLATLRAHGLGYADDPSNQDGRFERARWRTLTPELAAMGLTPSRFGTLARRMARLDDALDARVAALWPDIVIGETPEALRLDFAALVEEPEEIGLRILAHALERRGQGDDTILRLERLESCFAALCEARKARLALTRTLSKCLLTLTYDGVLVVGAERDRRRGVHLRLS